MRALVAQISIDYTMGCTVRLSQASCQASCCYHANRLHPFSLRTTLVAFVLRSQHLQTLRVDMPLLP